MVNRKRQTCCLGSPVQAGWGETGGGPTGGASGWSRARSRSLGEERLRELDLLGLAKSRLLSALGPQCLKGNFKGKRAKALSVVLDNITEKSNHNW